MKPRLSYTECVRLGRRSSFPMNEARQAMPHPLLNEAAIGRIVAAVEYIGTARFAVPAEDWPCWWRDLASGLDALAEHAWLHAGEADALTLMHRVEGCVAALEEALSATAPDLEGRSVLAALLSHSEAADPALLAALVGKTTRLLRLTAEHEARAIEARIAATGGPDPLAALPPDDRALAHLADAFDGAFVRTCDGEELRPAHTAGAKPGPFCRFAEAAFAEFAAAWATAHPGVPQPFGPPASLSPSRVRRVLALRARTPPVVWPNEARVAP